MGKDDSEKIYDAPRSTLGALKSLNMSPDATKEPVSQKSYVFIRDKGNVSNMNDMYVFAQRPDGTWGGIHNGPGGKEEKLGNVAFKIDAAGASFSFERLGQTRSLMEDRSVGISLEGKAGWKEGSMNDVYGNLRFQFPEAQMNPYVQGLINKVAAPDQKATPAASVPAGNSFGMGHH